MIKNVFNMVFGSFFRTLGRLLCYLLIGFLISFIFTKFVKANDINNLDYSVPYITINNNLVFNYETDTYIATSSGYTIDILSEFYINTIDSNNTIKGQDFLYNLNICTTDESYVGSINLNTDIYGSFKGIKVLSNKWNGSCNVAGYTGKLRNIVVQFSVPNTYYCLDGGCYEAHGYIKVYGGSSPSYNRFTKIISANVQLYDISTGNSYDISNQNQTIIDQNNQTINQNQTIIDQNNQEIQQNQTIIDQNEEAETSRKGIWASIKDGISSIGTWFTDLSNSIGGFFTNLINSIGGFFSDLFDIFTPEPICEYKDDFMKDAVKENFIFSFQGTVNNYRLDKSTSSSAVKSVYIEIEPNTKYTINTMASDSIYYCTATSVDNWTICTNSKWKTDKKSSYTITSGANDKYLVIGYYWPTYDSSTNEADEFNSLKVSVDNYCYSPTFLQWFKMQFTNMIDSFLDGIKSLFIPTESQLEEVIDKSANLTENFGFVGETVDFFINLFSTSAGVVNSNGCIHLPEFTLGSTTLFDSFTFWEEQNVCLSDNKVLNDNINTIRAITSIGLITTFMTFAASKFFNILSKDDNLTAKQDLGEINRANRYRR